MTYMDERNLAEQIEATKDDVDTWGEPTEQPPTAQKRRSERRQRGAVVSVRLTADELAKLQTYSERQGVSLSGALRAAGLEAANRPVRTTPQSRWPYVVGSITSAANENGNKIEYSIQSHNMAFAVR